MANQDLLATLREQSPNVTEREAEQASMINAPMARGWATELEYIATGMYEGSPVSQEEVLALAARMRAAADAADAQGARDSLQVPAQQMARNIMGILQLNCGGPDWRITHVSRGEDGDLDVQLTNSREGTAQLRGVSRKLDVFATQPALFDAIEVELRKMSEAADGR